MEASGIAVDRERVRPVCMPVGAYHPLMMKRDSWRFVRPVFRERTAPCTHACPTGSRVRDYIGLAGEGELGEAWRILREDNPMPAVTGRVCYHPCEEACNRASYDQPVAAHSIERLIGDYGLTQPPERAEVTRTEKIAVVGSGPAGLAAAYHLVRRGYPVTVLEAEPELGGMLRWGIPEYRLPRDILDREIGRIEAMGVRFVTGARLGAEISWRDLDRFDAVFLATGCHGSQRLGVPGEEGVDVYPGLAFLRDVNRGRFRRGAFAGRRVAVIGGGNVALDAARSALRLGAKEVAVVYRRGRGAMPANQGELRAAEEEGVRVHEWVSPLEIVRGGGPTGLRCVRNRPGEVDADGRPRPVAIPGSEFTLGADAVVAAVGQFADVSFVLDSLLGVGGTLAADRLGRVGDKIILAGGDLLTGPARVVDALGAGKRCAAEIDALLRGREAEQSMEAAVIEYDELNTAYFAPLPREEQKALPPTERVGSFQEVEPGLGPEATARESRRCFQCGSCSQCGTCWLFCPEMSVLTRDDRLEIDYDYCKGCGICAEECPRGAIDLEEEHR